MRTLATWSTWVACVMLGAWTAGAQTRVWTSTNNGTWSAGTNWLGGGAPPVSGATVHFPNLQAGTVTATVDAAWSPAGAVNGIVLDVGNGNNDWVGNYVLNSSGVGALGLGAGGITVLDDYISSANNYPEIAANLSLTASQAWNVLPYTPSTPSAAGGSVGTVLRLSGAVSGANPGTVFTKSGSWYMEIRGPNAGFGANISAIVLAGGRFSLVNGQAAGNSFDRIGDNTAIIGKGGDVVSVAVGDHQRDRAHRPVVDQRRYDANRRERRCGRPAVKSHLPLRQFRSERRSGRRLRGH